MYSPRKIVLDAIITIFREEGAIPSDPQKLHEKIFQLQERFPEISKYLTFSENYPFRWSYEVDEAIQSLLSDGILWFDVNNPDEYYLNLEK